MTYLEKINEVIEALPKKDKTVAENLIKSRKFDDLQDLIDSAIVIVKRSQNSKTPKEEYNDIDIVKLRELSSVVYRYRSFQETPFEEGEVIDFNDEDDSEYIMECD